jgi:PKD repeat protein
MKKTNIVIGVCLLSILSFFSGCVNEPESTQFSIVSFDIEPSMIDEGEYANLSWVVLNASSVTIDNGIGTVALTGHRLIRPAETTTYRLTASKATAAKNATAMITVKPNVRLITDWINDVSITNYLTGETTVITFSPYLNVNNIDITQASCTQQGPHVTLTLNVKGSIENRGNIIDFYSGNTPGNIDSVEYTFDLSTSGYDYSVSYSNGTGQLYSGSDQINLTSWNFSVSGNTLSAYVDLFNADETITGLTVSSTYIKANISSLDSGLIYLSDTAPNPALAISEAYAYDTGAVGESIQFNATIEPLTGQPPYTYHWDFGDQTSSTELNPTHTYTKPGHYTYTFTVTDQAGDTASQTGTITITP